MLDTVFISRKKALGHLFLAAMSVRFMAFAGEAHPPAHPSDLKAPATPANLQVPQGHVAYLKGFAAGTQNYVCLPDAGGSAWKFLGPQATLFATFPWAPSEPRLQITTHFLSPNPVENGTPRPTWQSSHDTSAVWGKAIAQSIDPKFVASGAIPWLLVEITGTQRGPGGGSGLAGTTYIQRVNTSGGVAPTDGCDATTYGKVAFAPYTTDYMFYRASRSR